MEVGMKGYEGVNKSNSDPCKCESGGCEPLGGNHPFLAYNHNDNDWKTLNAESAV